MWLCLNTAFFSIVAPKEDPDDRLLVRARRKGDIERVFDVPGVYSPGRDYAYRALLERDAVAAVVMCQVLGIQYGNFKDSVKEPALHSVYNAVWSVMGRLQVGGPYSEGVNLPRRVTRRQKALFGDLAGAVDDPGERRSPFSSSELADRLGRSLTEAQAWRR